MTPMIPKIRVSPLATRNSSSPYCTEFRHWMRKVARSMGEGAQVAIGGLLHPAAAARIGKRLGGDAHVLVLLAADLAQVDVLYRVVAGGDGEGATRAVDAGLAHGRGEFRLLRHVAL